MYLLLQNLSVTILASGSESGFVLDASTTTSFGSAPYLLLGSGIGI